MNLNSIGNALSNIKSSYYIDGSGNEANVTNGYPNFEKKIDCEVKKENQNDLNKNTSDTDEIRKKELDKSLKKLNRFLEDDAVHAEYSVHEDFGTVMVKIIDDKTKEIILEVPPKKILDMVASMCKQFGLIDKKA